MTRRGKRRAFAAVTILGLCLVGWGLLAAFERFFLEGVAALALDPDLFLTLPANRVISQRYQYCCMPPESLRRTDRTTLIRTDAAHRRVVEGNDPQGARVLFFGDSSIYGQSLSQGETIADRLAEMGAAAGRSLWIGNHGVPGTTSAVVRVQARRVIPAEGPAAVVLCVGRNDSGLAPDFVPALLDRAIALTVERRFPPRLVLADFLLRASARLAAARLFGAERRPLTAVEQYRANVTEAVTVARRADAPVIFLVEGAVGGDPAATDDMAAYRLVLAELAARDPAVANLDLSSLAREALPVAQRAERFTAERERIRDLYAPEWLAAHEIYWVTTDGGHPNAIFAEIIAWEIYAALHRLNPGIFPPAAVPDWRKW